MAQAVSPAEDINIILIVFVPLRLFADAGAFFMSVIPSLGGENQTFSFYYLKDVVTTGNVTSIAEGIFAQAAENVEGFGDTCVSNYATYSNPMWESRTAYRSITILLVLLSVCILTYLMATYIGKRKKHFIMMRELGASVFDVKLIQVYECLISVALIAVITFIVSFALSFVAALIISKANAIKLCFEFNARTSLFMIGVILVSWLVSAAFSVLIRGNRRISATKKRLVSITHLRKRAKKSRFWGPQRIKMQFYFTVYQVVAEKMQKKFKKVGCM